MLEVKATLAKLKLINTNMFRGIHGIGNKYYNLCLCVVSKKKEEKRKRSKPNYNYDDFSS